MFYIEDTFTYVFKNGFAMFSFSLLVALWILS